MDRPAGVSRYNIDAYILPGPETLHPPAPSSDPDVFTESLVQLRDDDLPSVEDARTQAAQMQAQMD